RIEPHGARVAGRVRENEKLVAERRGLEHAEVAEALRVDRRGGEKALDVAPCRAALKHARVIAAAALEQAPRAHRHEAAEDPCQREHAEDEARHVMPIPEAAKRRAEFLVLAAALETRDADIEAGRSEERADDGRPDHDLGPERPVLP